MAFLFIILCINVIYLSIVNISMVMCEKMFYLPFWVIVYEELLLNEAGKVIISILLGLLFLLADVCWLCILFIIRLLRHFGYWFWWAFAIDRLDVAKRYKQFCKERYIYYEYIFNSLKILKKGEND